MIRTTRKFLELPRGERRLLLEALVLLPLMTLGLKTMGLRRSLLLLARCGVGASGYEPEAGFARHRALRTGALVRAAAAHGPVRGSCLAHSLTIWWLLRRQGVQAALRIGIRRCGEGLQAHAWMEHRGCALNPDADDEGRFLPFGEGRGLLARLGAETP